LRPRARAFGFGGDGNGGDFKQLFFEVAAAEEGSPHP